MLRQLKKLFADGRAPEAKPAAAPAPALQPPPPLPPRALALPYADLSAKQHAETRTPFQHVVFIHIPRTGGATFTVLATQNVPACLWPPGPNPVEAIGIGPLQQQLNNGSRVFVGGHFCFNNELFHRLPGRHVLLTLLRDPLARVVSHYRFHKQTPGNHLYQAILADNLDLLAYVQKFHSVIPSQSSYFQPPADWGFPRGAAGARQVIEKHVTFFGLGHRFSEFAVMLNHFLGWDKVLYEAWNSSHALEDEGEQISRARPAIREIYRDDFELYAGAEELYQKRLRELGTAFSEDVAQLEKLQNEYTRLGRAFPMRSSLRAKGN